MSRDTRPRGVPKGGIAYVAWWPGGRDAPKVYASATRCVRDHWRLLEPDASLRKVAADLRSGVAIHAGGKIIERMEVV